MSASNDIFELPFFYIFDNKYIIIKDIKYSFYDVEIGDQITESSKLENILDLLNPFSGESDKQIFVDVYLAK